MDVLETIKEACKILTYRQREMVFLKYGLGDGSSYTDEEIGTIFKMTVTEVQKTLFKAIRKLQGHEASSILAGLMPEIDGSRQEGPENEGAPSISIEIEEAIASIKTLSVELLLHLKDNPEKLPSIDCYVFEHLVAECLASRGFEKVKLVGRESSTSADIFAVEKSISSGTSIKYFVEVKRHHKSIGVEVIDGVIGAIASEKHDWGWHVGLIVSLSGFKNFRKYSPDKLSLMGIELKDKQDVLGWIRDYRPSDRGLFIPAGMKQSILKNKNAM